MKGIPKQFSKICKDTKRGTDLSCKIDSELLFTRKKFERITPYLLLVTHNKKPLTKVSHLGRHVKPLFIEIIFSCSTKKLLVHTYGKMQYN